MKALALLVASFGYSGYAPVAPGTAGSLAALVVFGVLRRSGFTYLEPAIIVALFAAGVWAASRVARDLGRTDPGVVVVDEAVGMFLTFIFLPVSGIGVLLGFLLFRVFDVIKPFPAAQSEALPGGWGIMIDDVWAGIYAHLVLRVLAWAWPAWVLQ